MSDQQAVVLETLASGDDDHDVEGAGGRQYVAFTVGDEEYAVDIMVVREIRGWTKATPLPHAPRYVRGVVNLRGTIVPIMDLRGRFGHELTKTHAKTVVVILRWRSRTVGLLVDAVSDILWVDPTDIQPVPDDATNFGETPVEDLIVQGERLVGVLALDRLLGEMLRTVSADPALRPPT